MHPDDRKSKSALVVDGGAHGEWRWFLRVKGLGVIVITSGSPVAQVPRLTGMSIFTEEEIR